MEVQNKKGAYKRKVEPRWLSKWDKKLWLIFQEALQNPVPQKNYASKIERIYENKEAIFIPLITNESLIELINFIKSEYPYFYHKFAARNAICELQERMAWVNNAPLKSFCKYSREKKSLPAWYELLILADNDCHPKSLPPRKTLDDWFDEFNFIPQYKTIDLKSETFTAEKILAIFRHKCIETHHIMKSIQIFL